MNKYKLMDLIKNRLSILNPENLEIFDKSNEHIGHNGYQKNKKHYEIHISANHFIDRPLLECHRLIYDLLKDIIPIYIHAISIKII